jgi:hypothetical protein
MWGWILGGLAVIGGGLYVATRGTEEVDNGDGANGKGAGWYVLRFDRVGEGSSKAASYDKLPDGRSARLKEFARYDTKEEANAAAHHAREHEGWRGKDVKVLVDYRGRGPF